jgi:hypothetical protein
MQLSKITMPPFTQLDLFGHGLMSIDLSEEQIPTSNISKAT